MRVYMHKRRDNDDGRLGRIKSRKPKVLKIFNHINLGNIFLKKERKNKELLPTDNHRGKKRKWKSARKHAHIFNVFWLLVSRALVVEKEKGREGNGRGVNKTMHYSSFVFHFGVNNSLSTHKKSMLCKVVNNPQKNRGCHHWRKQPQPTFKVSTEKKETKNQLFKTFKVHPFFKQQEIPHYLGDV